MSQLQTILDGKDNTIHTTEVDTTVFDAIDKMCRQRIGALLVMKGDIPIGIISEKDVMTRVILQKRDPAAATVGSVMTQDLWSVDINTEPNDVIDVMTRRRCRHIPVVDGQRVAGFVSMGDLLYWSLRNRDGELRSLREYVSGGYESYNISVCF